MVDIKISQLTNVSSSQLTDLFEISRNLGGGSFESHSLTYRDLLHSIVGDNIITVDSGGADATSIEDAISQANAKVPSSTNPVVILVHPGVYTENNPLTVPDYVSIISLGDSNTTSILATTTTSPIFIMGNYSWIKGVTLKNASGVGGVAVKCIGLNGVLEDCVSMNCETGIWVSGATAYLRASSTAIINVPGQTCTYAYRADDGSTLTLLGVIANGTTSLSKITYGIYAYGVGTKIITSTSFAYYCTNGVYADNGAFIDGDSGFVKNCDNGLHIGVNGSNTELRFLSASITDSTTYDVFIESITGHIDFTGLMDYGKRSIVNGGKFHSVGIDEDQERLIMTGEANIEEKTDIGVPGSTTESLGVGLDVGEGGSYVNDQYGVEIVEYWAYDASAASGSRFTRYANNAGTQLTDVGDAIVVGSKYPFSATRMDINVASNLGGNSIVVEHWNGATWTTDTVCAYRKSDMLNRGNVIFQNVETQYIEVGKQINDDWISDDNVLDNVPDWDYSSDMYPLRFRNNGGSLTTAMEFDSGQVRGDDFDVTEARETVNWGRYRGTETTIRLVSDTVPSSTNPPVDETVTVSPNIDGVWKAKFTDGNVCSSSFKQIIPDWADISSGITLAVNMYASNANVGAVDITIRYVPVVPGFVFDGSATEYSAELITTTPGVTKELFSVDYTFDISGFSPGDEFIVAMERDATAGNANDTYSGDIVLTGFKMEWTRKIVG